MMARSQENGDRFSLKEGNSIATLITDAVLALNGEDTRQARRAMRRRSSASNAWRLEAASPPPVPAGARPPSPRSVPE